MSDPTSGRPLVEQPPSKAPGGRPAPPDAGLAGEATALAELLAEVVRHAQQRAVYPGRWQQIADLAMEFPSVRAAVAADEPS